MFFPLIHPKGFSPTVTNLLFAGFYCCNCSANELLTQRKNKLDGGNVSYKLQNKTLVYLFEGVSVAFMKF